MADRKKYPKLREQEEMIRRCYRCGLCRTVCPSFRETGSEGSSPRGRIQYARTVLDGEASLSGAVAENMLDCLNCTRCADVCPADVSAAKIVLAARADMAANGDLMLAKKLAFNGVLKHPAFMALSAKLAAFGKRLFYDSSELLNALVPRFAGMGDKKFPSPVTAQTMGRWPERVPAESGKPVMRVAYFIGCATNLIYPEVADATIQVLTCNGVEVVIPRGQACCGIPVYTSGDFENARKLAEVNRKVFSGLDVDCIVTDCGSCSAALKHEVEELTGLKPFDVPVYDINEFLAGKIELAKPEHEVRVKVTYHDPCHLKRAQGIWREPRELLEMIPGLEFVEMDDADYCCGGAGTFAYTHHDLSRKVGATKTDSIRRTGASHVVTPCPSCTMQIEDLLSHEGMGVKLVHPVVLLARAYGFGEDEKNGNSANKAEQPILQ